LFKSPTKGGKFNFNLNLAGVNSAIVEDPAQVPMWFEWLPDPKERVAVAFADGHAKLCNPAILGDTRAHSTPSDPESLVKFLKRRYTRSNGMKPLPANYMLTGH